MKTIVHLILATLITGLFIFSCEKLDNSDDLSLTGQLTSDSGCKNGIKSASGNDGTSDSISCINYTFESLNNKLAITHINAGFNCCPESLYYKVTLKNNTIIVQEFEKSTQCKCNCLYDLKIEIAGVRAKKYQVKIVEPYAGTQAKLIFGIDLTNETEGSFCVSRNQYPWNM